MSKKPNYKFGDCVELVKLSGSYSRAALYQQHVVLEVEYDESAPSKYCVRATQKSTFDRYSSAYCKELIPYCKPIDSSHIRKWGIRAKIKVKIHRMLDNLWYGYFVDIPKRRVLSFFMLLCSAWLMYCVEKPLWVLVALLAVLTWRKHK